MNLLRISYIFLLSVFLISCCLEAYEIVSENNTTKHLGYGDWYINTDGELHLMQQLLRPQDTVFDVGANVGEWSLYALGVEKSILLYSFEPLPVIFSDLKNKLSNYSNANAFNLALSDQIGKSNFCYYDETYDFSGLSGFYVREVLKADHQPPQMIEVAQDTLLHFCLEHSIDKIDFLKIDAEGAEWIILKGASALIENNKIRAIQFEYGGCYVDAKTKLKDVFYLLSNNDYLIFRIMPHGLIRIAEWNSSLENFELSNYLAIKKEDVLDRLGMSFNP